MDRELIKLVREKAVEKLLFLPHATRQMIRPERMISTSDVRKVLMEGEIIEDYPDDARGHSCLILGFGEGERPLHVVCSPKDDYLVIITAYVPYPDQWDDEYRSRREK